MTPTVYFAAADNGPIKIGMSISVEKRIAALQTSAPCEIKLLAAVPGNRRTEAFFHGLVASHRLSGEWFAREPEVLYLVEAVNKRGLDVVPEPFRIVGEPIHIKQKLNERSSDIIASARYWIGELADPRPFGELIGESLERVAENAGVSSRTVKSIWYGETEQLKADVYVGLKEAFDAKMSNLLRTMART